MATGLDVHCDTDEWWRECAAWLTRCEMLRSDHRANYPTGAIRDLANILRDGVLLCQLLNKLDPGCIDMKEVNLKPTMAQFLCLHNIEIFLKTCISNFDLQQNDIFEPLMLFDLSDFHKVLCTLSKLSLCPKALRGNIEGFEAKNRCQEDEKIYQYLKTDEPQTRVPEFDRSTEEAIYQDLLETRELQLPSTLQKRDFVIKELMDTEKNYVEVLSKLKKYFVNPLRSLTYLKQEDHEVIFCKIDDLYTVHSEFYLELRKSTKDPQKKLSAIFMQWREKFLIYGKYCANLMRATNLLQDLCDTNPNFNFIILSYEKEYSDSRFKLRDVLSVPMQRILKYHLLLEKLIENTDPNHEEYYELKRAREAMMDVAHYINEAARDSDHQVAVISKLQKNIIEWDPSDNHDLLQYGRLIKDIELKIKHHDDQRTRTRYVFIFYKCILICKQHKNNQFVYRDIINIVDYHVEELQRNRPILNKDARWSYPFHLVKNDNNTAYTFFVRSPEIKKQLIQAINDALDNIHPPAMKHTNHSFQLHSFDDPIQCQYCSKYLKGLFHQGYKCAVCGIASHKACIGNSGRCGAASHNSMVSQNCVNGTEGSLKYMLWFVGEMDRTTAQEKLDKRENGTYLVRIRPQSEERDKYALSLKTSNKVTHMKIFSNMDSHQRKYYMSLSKFFNSIEELILNYQTQDLRENFTGLEMDTRLLWPFKQLQVTALRNYRPAGENEIELTEGQTLLVIGKEGYIDGWWRGRTDASRTGYFPSSHVRIETEVTF